MIVGFTNLLLNSKLNKNTNFNYQLYNAIGELVKIKNMNIEESTNKLNYTIDVSGLAEGIYLLKTTIGNSTKTEQLVIEK